MRHSSGAMATSSIEKSSPSMYLFFRKIGANWVRRSRICARAFSSCLSLALTPPRPSRMLTFENSSFSKLNRNRRTRARATGSPGISCGCGKRSSMYSLMMCDSYRMRSRSTRMGTSLYGFISAMSSGLAKRSTSRISKSMPFSNSTKRQRCEYGSVVPEYSTIMAGGSVEKTSRQKNTRPASRSKEPLGRHCKPLFHVFPVRRVQPPAEDPEHAEEDEYPDTQLHAEVLRRFAHPLQVGNEIRDVGVVFGCAARARGFHLEALEHVLDLPVLSLFVLKDRALGALELPQHVRHADVRENVIIPSRGPRLVAVERSEVGVEVIRPRSVGAGTGPGDHGQVGRDGPEEGLGVLGSQAGLHQVAHLLAGEQKIGFYLIVGQADVVHAVVAHVRRLVAVQAVVDEQLGAVLQGGLVGQAFGGELVPGRAAFLRGRGATERERHEEAGDETLHEGVFLHGDQCAWKVTRSGTGLNVPCWLHHGISRKKLKYSTVPTCEMTFLTGSGGWMPSQPRIRKVTTKTP